MNQRQSLEIQTGFATQTGRRDSNQDFVACFTGTPQQRAIQGIAVALADGMGGHKGGREASELTVRSFLDGYYALPATLGVQKAAARALESINSWIFSQGRSDPNLRNMGTTFSALIFQHRSAYMLHVGDSRIYRLSEGRLELLTQDHTMGRGDLSHVLTRAIGLEDYVRMDHAAHTLRIRDRYLICSDGVYAVLSDTKMQSLLGALQAPEQVAEHIIEAALAAGSDDNVTALVADIVDLPPAQKADLMEQVASQPILPPPSAGDTIDGYKLDALLSDGHYSRLFLATEPDNLRQVVLKFPQPKVADDAVYRLAFVREAYVAARVRSPWIGEIIEPAPGRQTGLYSIMPYYPGETLESRLRRTPKLTLIEGSAIASKLARAVVTLHRAGIIHRDIKPDNIILETATDEKAGGLRLVDLGVARVPKMEDFAAQDIPGTPSYMAPELFADHAGNEASDQFALGVTLYRALTGAYPYGEVEPFSRPRFGKPMPLSRHRPDLPAWLDMTLARAIAVNPQERFGDVVEFALELENGAIWNRPPVPVSRPLYDLNPLLFWKLLSAVLMIALLAVMIWK